MKDDNREIMDIDYETDVQCYRVMPQGKSVVETKSTCDGCRYNPEKCIINRLLILKSVINEGLERIAQEASGKEPNREKYTDEDCFTLHIRLFDLDNLRKVTAVAVECLEESLKKYKKEFEEL